MFDSHAHVVSKEFDSDRPDVLVRAQEAGFSGWLEVGNDLRESRLAVEFAKNTDGVFATVGVHPNSIGGLTEEGWAELELLARHPKVVAIGEVGFDFFRDGTRAIQEPVLKRFIDLAQRKTLPMVFHVRDGATAGAHEALVELLHSYPSDLCPRGVIHTYSGTVEQATKYLELGLYLSFSGVVTFKNAGQLVDVVAMVPADKFLVETDCPYLTPVPHRGQRNEPAFARLVAEKVADIRGVGVDEIERLTDENAKRLFSIP